MVSETAPCTHAQYSVNSTLFIEYRSAFLIGHISKFPCWECLKRCFRGDKVLMHLGIAAYYLFLGP